jgi:hypothetical protein
MKLPLKIRRDDGGHPMDITDSDGVFVWSCDVRDVLPSRASELAVYANRYFRLVGSLAKIAELCQIDSKYADAAIFDIYDFAVSIGRSIDKDESA